MKLTIDNDVTIIVGPCYGRDGNYSLLTYINGQQVQIVMDADQLRKLVKDSEKMLKKYEDNQSNIPQK